MLSPQKALSQHQVLFPLKNGWDSDKQRWRDGSPIVGNERKQEDSSRYKQGVPERVSRPPCLEEGPTTGHKG